MSVGVFSNTEGAVFYCTTTDWAFGPVMPGENVAEAFLKYLPKDARLYEDHELESAWNRFNETLMHCPYGHDKPDPELYGDKIVFSCCEDGCKVQWDLQGNVIEEEDEDDDLTEAERLGEARVMR
jgi:hypothetical protein